MAYTPLTTEEEIKMLFSDSGVDLRLLSAGDASATLDWFIKDATTTVTMYAGQRYEVSTLATDNYIRIAATWIAAYRLSQREGNPSLFHVRYQEIMVELEQIRDGILPLIDANTRWDMVPSISNIVHDPRHRSQTLRVDRDTSTAIGGTRPQDVADNPFYFNEL